MHNELKIKVYTNVELKIIAAANKVFLQYGSEASTMQQIAQEAEISRTALHYYFRNKSQLYECIIEILAEKVIPALSSILESNVSVIKKIELFICSYIDLVIEYPMVPGFILSEMQRESNWILNIFERKISDESISLFQQQLEEEVLKGEINPINIIDLISNVMGLCVFPIVGRPIYLKYIFDEDLKAYQEYLEGRKKTIINVIKAWIVPQKLI